MSAEDAAFPTFGTSPKDVAGAARAMWAAAYNPAQDATRTERDGLSAARREMDAKRADIGVEISELEATFDASERERASPAKTRAG
jgi:hypothetical protein